MSSYIYSPSANGNCIERIDNDDVADAILTHPYDGTVAGTVA